MIYANKSADLQQEQEGRRANSKTGRNLSIATCFNAFLSRGDKIFLVGKITRSSVIITCFRRALFVAAVPILSRFLRVDHSQ